MKTLIIVLVMIIGIGWFIPHSEGKSNTYPLEVTSLTITFEKTNATFTVEYELGRLPKLYVLLLGSKNIEPRIKTIFSNFDYDVLKIDPNKAILRVNNISRFDRGYYFHDSRKLGMKVNTIIVYTPDSQLPIRYANLNLNSTPDIFYYA